MWINRNNSFRKGYTIDETDVIKLDLSMPKNTFRIGFIWWNMIDFVHKYFPDNYSHGCPSNGGYDTLVVKGTTQEISLIIDMFLEKHEKHHSLHVKQFNRYIKCYNNKIKRGENVQCLEGYLYLNLNKEHYA